MLDTKATVGAIMVDCRDPDTLFDFWSQITGVEIAQRYPDYIFTTPLGDSSIRLAFQSVDEDKISKNRLHLDLNHENPEEFINAVIHLGGSKIQDHEIDGFGWTVLQDPEGNEFCVTSVL